jgi:hypothetical protein
MKNGLNNHSKMTDSKLYSKYIDGKYHEAVAIHCDVCGEIFQVRKGFIYGNNPKYGKVVIACYKHLTAKDLEMIHCD